VLQRETGSVLRSGWRSWAPSKEGKIKRTSFARRFACKKLSAHYFSPRGAIQPAERGGVRQNRFDISKIDADRHGAGSFQRACFSEFDEAFSIKRCLADLQSATVRY
jgi:hypothetical protein